MSDELFGACFPKLSVGNFAEWRVMMEAELTRRRLWTDIVEVEVDGDGKSESEILAELTTKLKARDKQKMAEARAEMILRGRHWAAGAYGLEGPTGDLGEFADRASCAGLCDELVPAKEVLDSEDA